MIKDNKKMVTKSSPFDLDFSKEYQSLRKSKKEIQQQIDPLVVADAKGNLQQINALVAKRKVYDDAIIKLLQTETKKYCEQYAKKMFDISLDIIERFLPDAAMNFDKLSIEEKLDFGQVFINHLAKRLEIVPNKLVFIEKMLEYKGADYDFETCNINIKEKDVTNATLQYFIGEILHEYTHYLYDKYPELSPVGEQKAWAVMENFVFDSPSGIQNEADLEAYKQRPFEAPAYYVQDYFEKHKFGEIVLSGIITKNVSSTKEFTSR